MPRAGADSAIVLFHSWPDPTPEAISDGRRAARAQGDALVALTDVPRRDMEQAGGAMSVRLTPDEAWDVLARPHTGILTTLRRDGMPISLPMWFVALDRTICIGAPSRTKKLARLRHDPRASFLVESGERWVELEAVHLTGGSRWSTDEADDRAHRRRARREVRRLPHRSTAMPQATRDALRRAHVSCASCPTTRILTWDNAREARA